MTDDLYMLGPSVRPSTSRPLSGVTVLLVEDSRFASDAIRLICLRSGARIRRADCLSSARRHLLVYRPTVVIIDLGLPDGHGSELIAELDQSSPRINAILGTSGDDGGAEVALRAGADGFLTKPVTSLAEFQNLILSLLNDPARRISHAPSHEAVEPDPIALRDDLRQVAEVLRGRPDTRELRYLAQFTGGLARNARDQRLARAAELLAHAERPEGAAADLADLIHAKLSEPAPM